MGWLQPLQRVWMGFLNHPTAKAASPTAEAGPPASLGAASTCCLGLSLGLSTGTLPCLLLGLSTGTLYTSLYMYREPRSLRDSPWDSLCTSMYRESRWDSLGLSIYIPGLPLGLSPGLLGTLYILKYLHISIYLGSGWPGFSLSVPLTAGLCISGTSLSAPSCSLRVTGGSAGRLGNGR